MDERFVFTSRATLLRWLVLAPAIVAGVVVAAAASWIWWLEAGAVGVLALVTAGGVAWRLRRPVPLLRLSPDGFEGAFGLIGWHDVVGVEVKTRLAVDTRSVIVRVRPEGWLLDPTRTFAKNDDVLDLRRDRITVDTGGLDIDADALVRTIERYRASA